MSSEDRKIRPEIIGYIKELHEQINYLSDRAAGIAAQLAVATETIELQNSRISALEKEQEDKC
jgi:hypothetical protein